MQLFSNNAVGTLVADINATQTTIELQAGDGAKFNAPPNVDYELITLSNGTDIEIVKVTARAGDVFTVVRGQERTAAAGFLAGDIVFAGTTAATLARIPFIDSNNGYVSGGDMIPTYPYWQAGISVTDGYTIQVSIGNESSIYRAIGSFTTGATEPAWGWSDSEIVPDNVTGKWLCVVAWINYGNHTGVGAVVKPYGYDGTACGKNALAGTEGTAVGSDSVTGWQAFSGGFGAAALTRASTVLGYQGYITAGAGRSQIAIGDNAGCDGSKDNLITIGRGLYNEVEFTHLVGGLPLIARDYAFYGSTDEHWRFAGSQGIVMSKVIDLTVALDDAAVITIPFGATFFPDEVGLIITQSSGVTGQPSVSFGVTGDTVALSVSTATTKNAVKAREILSLLSPDGVSSLTASVKVAGTATTLKGRFYFKGMLVQDQ